MPTEYTSEQVAHLLKTYGLYESDERFESHVDDYLAQLNLIASIGDRDYGETSPSGTFRAAWT
ncbi:hypothetical protein [Brevibacterium litoralis]|uniref:hypothetical protein n=1 Tax=Brevibacterium litoralis TaxID=3138935 RepID=UPI0032EB9370